MHLAPDTLEKLLRHQFPCNATCWSQATDEVRDMSRKAREILELDDKYAVNFRGFESPAAWNTNGVASIVHWYKHMNGRQQQEFCAFFERWLELWAAQPVLSDRAIDKIMLAVIPHAGGTQ